jgi:hypothetical protein
MLRKLYDICRHAPASWIAKKIEMNAREELRKNHKLWLLLEAYLAESHSTGASFSDYAVLYHWVRKHRPQEVLECGTGVTTVVIAQALKENHKEYGVKGRVTSMEEDEKYFDVARSIFPEILRDYAEIILSPAIEDHYHIFRGTRYKDIPERPYEFVFIDGPILHMDPKGDDVAFSMDLVRLIAKSERPISAVVDTRTVTCFVYSLLFPRTFRYDYLRKIGIVGPSTKNDLLNARTIVIDAMRRHSFKGPNIGSLFSGQY